VILLSDWPRIEHNVPKVLIPGAAIALVFLLARRRKLSHADDLGLRPAPLGEATVWVLLYAAWMLGTNHFMNWRGPWDFSGWAAAPVLVNILRVVGVGVLGPIAEELIFRGGLFSQLMKTRLKAAGTILVTALAWSVLHYSYTAGVIAVIFVDGLLLGAARYRTRSVYVPIVMHLVWNFYAMW
jgi:membrane protease YdiL (CAAX protease family)